MIVMAALGLGTVPGLLAVGLSGGLVAGRIKAVGLRVAGVVLICLGTLTVLRGTEVMHHGHAGHEGTMMMEPTGPIHEADDRL
jgi:sulfite exporter TauE/SafE